MSNEGNGAAVSKRVRTIEEAAREALAMVESVPADQAVEALQSAVMLAAEEYGVDAEAVTERVTILQAEAAERAKAAAERPEPQFEVIGDAPAADAIREVLGVQPGPGVEAPVEEEPAFDPAEVGRVVAGQPSTGELEQALADFRLQPAHVLAWAARGDAITLVTAGGRKLQWPADKGRVLTQNERDGTPSQPKYPEGYLNRKATK